MLFLEKSFVALGILSFLGSLYMQIKTYKNAIELLDGVGNKLGTHIAVREPGGHWHHGIFVGKIDEKYHVVHVHDNEVSLWKLSEFHKNHGAMQYAEIVYPEETLSLEHCSQLAMEQVGKRDTLENFSMLCTGNYTEERYKELYYLLKDVPWPEPDKPLVRKMLLEWLLD